MKVVQVIKSLGLGGAERLLVDGARVGPSIGLHHEVVSFLPHKTALVDDLRAAGAPVTIIEARSSPGVIAAADRLARYLRVSRPDVVHAHLPVAAVVARLACRTVGIPCVMTEHNVLERYHTLTRLLSLSTWNLLDHVVACSEEVAASIERHVTGAAAPPVTVVRNGIEVARFDVDEGRRREIRARLGLEESAPLVGTVAVLRTQKALDRWLRVAKAVLARVPAAHFVIVGDGPLRGELEALATSLSISARVHFVGLQTDPASWLAAMDVWLSTSLFEGLPLALLEALAAERAVVATAVGGVPEVVVDTCNGRLLKADDEAGLVEAVCGFCVDRESARRAGVAGRAVVEKQFGILKMQRHLLDVYRSVLS